MGKLKSDERGFSAVEVILVLVIVALIGAVGFMVYKNHNKTKIAPVASTTTAKQTAPTQSKTTIASNPYAGWQTFSSVDKVYAISYPSDWVGVSDPCVAAGSCHTDTFGYDNMFSPSANPSWQVVTAQHTNSTQSPQAWLDQYEQLSAGGNCLYSADSAAVNGYQAYFIEDFNTLNGSSSNCPTSPPQGAYTVGEAGGTGYMDYYAVANKGQVVMFSMPVQDGSNGTRNTVPLIPTFNKIVQSIKFSN